MDHHLFTALENQNDGLKQTSPGVEAEPQLTMRPIIVIKGLNPLGPIGRLDSVLGQHSVLERT